MLARLFVEVGHQVALSNSRGPGTLRELVSPLGETAHAATAGGSTIGRRSFMDRYVFPDGELIEVGEVVLAMQGRASRSATSNCSASTTPARSGSGWPT